MNLRVKINIASAFLVLVVVLGMMSSLYISEKKQLLNDIRQEQKEDLGKLAKVYEEAMFADNEVILLNYVKTLVVSPHVAYAGFVSKDGNGWVYPWSDEEPLHYADSKDPFVKEILASHRLQRRFSTAKDGKEVIEVSRPIRAHVFVRLAYSRSEINHMVANRLNQSLQKLTFVGFIAILFGLILAHFVSRALSQPIMNLMNATNAIAKGSKGITIPEAGKR